VREMDGRQGASGSRIRYFFIQAGTREGGRVEERVVIKECGPVERSTLNRVLKTGGSGRIGKAMDRKRERRRGPGAIRLRRMAWRVG